MKKYDRGLMWFRRDLRANDNAALWHALSQCRQLHCVFVYDSGILAPLPKDDRRVAFIHASLQELDGALRQSARAAGLPEAEQVGLLVAHGVAQQLVPALAERLGVQAVFCNHDDEPAALQRDAQVLGQLAHQGILLQSHKDHVIFERREILTQNGRPFGVFTPYKNAWLKAVQPSHLKPYPCQAEAGALAPRTLPALPELGLFAGLPSLPEIGFAPEAAKQLKLPAGASGAEQLYGDFLQRIDRYQQSRDFPAIKGPSYLSVHLRFGTVSVRGLASAAYALHLQGQQGASTWLSELIWRDFYHQIMANHPHVVERAFKPEYDRIRFETGAPAKALFAAWCEGRTGYPLVDAAMAQINQTGYMHNRLRMVVACFLVKDLGLHWQWGERYFAEKLIDFDLAANNGGWQWASSSGCDAQPYFRIFNPITQSQRFDAEGKFIRRYLPQLAGLSDKAVHAPWTASPVELASAGLVLGRDYPLPVVDHAEARVKTLERYKAAM